MKKLAGLGLWMLAGAAMALAQSPAAKGPSVSQALKQLEHDWIGAESTGDVDKLDQIVADDWVLVGYDGKRETKREMLSEVKSGKNKLESLEFGPMDIKVLGNVAVVQCSDTEKSSSDGKDTSGKWVWMDVFVRRDGKWVAVRSQYSRVK